MAARVGAKGVERSCRGGGGWVSGGCGGGKGGAYGGVKVQNVDAVGVEFLEAGLDRRQHLVGLVLLGLVGVDDLGGERQAAVLPAGVACPSLLGAADVDARRVDLVVAAGLEHVESLFEVVDTGDAGAGGLVGAKGHEAEDDAVPGGLGDEGGHGGEMCCFLSVVLVELHDQGCGQCQDERERRLYNELLRKT